MTLVICPNLAIDRMLAADRVRPGGTTRCRALRTQVGGKGANTARATRALGGEALLTGFAAGRGGRLIAELAQAEGLELEAVVTGGEARVSTVVLGDDGSVTRLYEFGPEVGAAAERSLVDLVGARTAHSPGRRHRAYCPASTPPSSALLAAPATARCSTPPASSSPARSANTPTS
jgi:fructose-1-phosphate kinase PfkB-like protein